MHAFRGKNKANRLGRQLKGWGTSWEHKSQEEADRALAPAAGMPREHNSILHFHTAFQPQEPEGIWHLIWTRNKANSSVMKELERSDDTEMEQEALGRGSVDSAFTDSLTVPEIQAQVSSTTQPSIWKQTQVFILMRRKAKAC